MPDDQDHTELARLLADPRAWTAAERSRMSFLLRQQTALLSAVHPLDDRGRVRLQTLVDQISAAIGRSG